MGRHSIREYIIMPTSLHPYHPSSDSVDMCLPRNEQFPLRIVQSVRYLLVHNASLPIVMVLLCQNAITRPIKRFSCLPHVPLV